MEQIWNKRLSGLEFKRGVLLLADVFEKLRNNGLVK